MNKLVLQLSLFSLICMTLYSCSSDKNKINTDQENKDSTELQLSSDSESSPIKEADKVLKNLHEEEKLKDASVPIDSLHNLSVVDAQQIQKEAEAATQKRMKVVADQVKSSSLKDKSCAEIYEDYKALVEKYLETEDDSVLEPMTKWSNDPIFNSCKKDPDYKKKYEALDEQMMMMDY